MVTLTGSTSYSKYQTPAGLLFPPGATSVRPAVSAPLRTHGARPDRLRRPPRGRPRSRGALWLVLNPTRRLPSRGALWLVLNPAGRPAIHPTGPAGGSPDFSPSRSERSSPG